MTDRKESRGSFGRGKRETVVFFCLCGTRRIKNYHTPHKSKTTRCIYFLRKEQPSVRRALPPVGWQRTVVQPWQMTTVCACEKTVVMVKQPGHLTSMKKLRGAGTRVLSLYFLASAAALGFSRSTARTYRKNVSIFVV